MNSVMEKPELSGQQQQLSFDDLMGEQENSRVLALIPYAEMKARKFEFPQKRFFMLSVFVHLVLAGYALTIAIEKLQKTEVVEVEYISAATSSLPPAPVAYSAMEAPKVEVPEEKSADSMVTVSKPTPSASAAKRPIVKEITPAPIAVKTKASKPATPAATPTAKSSTSQFKAEPLATISDIEIPALSEVAAEPSRNLSLKEIESDFENVDDDQTSKLLAAAQDDAKLIDDSISDLDNKMAALTEEKSETDDLANERLQALKDQKSKLKESALASARADEAARAQAAANAKALKGPKGTPVENAGNGNDNDALTANNGNTAGVGSQSDGLVRKLEDLRQKPGNPRPSYDVADRMNGLQGTIIINAYVTKEGNLTLFRLIQSTGHRSLDRKSLAALKQWKFYPGQEGWVELPFKWDLKGGVQQKPTLLKRR